MAALWSAMAFENRGIAFAAQGMFDKASAIYSAISIDPKFVSVCVRNA